MRVSGPAAGGRRRTCRRPFIVGQLWAAVRFRCGGTHDLILIEHSVLRPSAVNVAIPERQPSGLGSADECGHRANVLVDSAVGAGVANTLASSEVRGGHLAADIAARRPIAPGGRL